MAKRGQGEGTIAKRADGTWWARITVGKTADGKQKRKAFYGKTRKEVQEKLTAALNELNNNTYIEPSAITLEKWLITWLEEYKKPFVRTTTYENYKKQVKWISQEIGQIKLKELRLDMVQKFIIDLNKRMSGEVVRKAKSVLHMAMEQAVENDMLKTNIIDRCKVPKGRKQDWIVLTREEQKTFIEIAKQKEHGEIYIFALATGMRIGEILALTWEDIDWEEKTVSVSKTMSVYRDETGKYSSHIGEPKTKSSYRTIPLLPNIIELLKQIRKKQLERSIFYSENFSNNNLVFCNYKGKILSYADAQRWFYPIRDELEKDGLHIHSLRHTFATRCLENGIELKVVQELLGHSNINMTADIYSHVLPEKKQESIQKIANTINF